MVKLAGFSRLRNVVVESLDVNLFLAATKKHYFCGTVALKKEAMLPVFCRDDITIKTDYQFYFVKEKVPAVKGHYDCQLMLTCQRCLEFMDIKLSNPFHIAFIKENENISLDDDIEMIDFQNNISMNKILLDELLLAMPMVSKHEKNCRFDDRQNSVMIDNENKPNPFATLKVFKQ